jgi:cell division protein FtsZ
MLQEIKPPKIAVIGVGNSGRNIVNYLLKSDIVEVDFVVIDYDIQDLHKNLADIELRIGEQIIRKSEFEYPNFGRESAKNDRDKIKKLLGEVDMLFITTGMGGSIGTGASPVIAEIAKEMGILTIGIVTSPFSLEGKNRANIAKNGIAELIKAADSTIIISNDKLFDSPDIKITLQNTFEEANKGIKLVIHGIIDSLLKSELGLINLDLYDFEKIMKDSGLAMFGFGEADGKNRAQKAAEKALQSPFFDAQVFGSGKVLLNITGDESLGLEESRIIQEIVANATGREIKDVEWGIIFDEEMRDKVQVSIFVTSFDNNN